MAGYVTTEELADYMSINDSDDDTQLEQAIDASSRAIDAWCQRNFTPDTVATTRVFRGENSWTACVDDFHDLPSLVLKTDSADNGIFDQTWVYNTDFLVEPSNITEVDGVPNWPYTKLIATGSRYFPRGIMGAGLRPRVQVTAKWGWPAVPDAVKQATFIKAARIFRRRNAPESQGGFDAGAGFAMPLIRVNVREDPDVVNLLASYRRLTLFA